LRAIVLRWQGSDVLLASGFAHSTDCERGDDNQINNDTTKRAIKKKRSKAMVEQSNHVPLLDDGVVAACLKATTLSPLLPTHTSPICGKETNCVVLELDVELQAV
jgi:hypothetical protein